MSTPVDPVIGPHDTVVIHYVGTLADGTEFDRSGPHSPLTFQLGKGQVIPGLEQAIIGRRRGESFTVTIPAAQAYGPVEPNLCFSVAREQVPGNINPVPGMALHVSTDQGELEVVVSAVDENSITLDANHPLAGKDLTFALTLV